jgi:hypothetical protein
LNAAFHGTKDSVREIVNLGCIPGLCKLLEHNDARAIYISMEAIKAILEKYEPGEKIEML